MSEAASLLVRIGADISDLNHKVDAASSTLKKGFLPGLVGAELIADGIKAVASGVASYVQGVISHLGEVEALNAQTEAVIKSTGAAAGITAAQVSELAGSISDYSGVGDEAIQTGANLLLTFTNIKNGVGAGNDVFNQTTKLMTDMSVAMGTDAKGAAIMLGKALNDPVQGISALTRVGVSFTDGQKATIKALQESGDLMGAQKVILAELNKEFGGSAEAFGRTFPGAVGRLDEAFEGLGDALVESTGAMTVITNAIGMTSESVGKLGALVKQHGIGGTFDKLVGPEVKVAILGIAVAFTASVVPALYAAGSAAVITAAKAAAAWAAASAPILAVAAAIAVAAYPIIVKNWDELGQFFQTLWRDIEVGAEWLFGVFREVFGKAAEVVGKAVGFIRDKLGALFNLLPKQAKDLLGQMAGNVGDAFMTLPNLAIGGLKGVTHAVGGMVTDGTALFNKLTASIPGAMAPIAGHAGKAIGDAGKEMEKQAKAAAAAVKKQLVDEIAKAFAELPGKLNNITAKARIFGEEMEVDARKAAALRSEIEALIDKGVKPTDKALQKLIGSWRQYSQAAADAKAMTALGQSALEDFKTPLVVATAAQSGLTASIGSFKASATDVLTSITGLKDGLKTIGETLGIDTNNAFVDGAAKAVSFGLALVQVGTSMQTLIPAVGSMLQSLGPLTQGIVDMLPQLGLMATQLWTTVIPAFGTWAAETTAATWPLLAIVAAVAAVGVALVALYQNVEGFRTAVNAAWESIAAGATGAFSGMAGVVSAAFDAVVGNIKGSINLISSAINFLIRGMNSIRISVPSWVPGIGGKGWGGPGIPEIPMLAKGGVVDGAMQAVIGEAGPEAVVPLKPSVLAGIGAGIHDASGGAGGTTVYVTIQVDDTQVGKRLVKTLREAGIKL